jgi:hypothetical protein
VFFHDFGRIAVFPSEPEKIQAKMRVNTPADRARAGPFVA